MASEFKNSLGGSLAFRRQMRALLVVVVHPANLDSQGPPKTKGRKLSYGPGASPPSYTEKTGD